jgi:rsbT co-antagonist protein RsbR
MTTIPVTLESTVKVSVGGMHVEFDPIRGQCFWNGEPVVSLWVNSSMVSLMVGLKRMVGLDRFKLALQSGGRENVDGDWQFISSFPTFEEGFTAIGESSWAAGWGRWELVHLDRARREVRLRAYAPWEAGYQRALGVVWGSSMLAGKFAGIGTRLFGTNCWAEQTAFAADNDAFDEFIIRPSELTVERELNRLLRSAEVTSADLPVALEKLENEIVEREKVEQDLREKISLIERQRADISALSTPIVQIWRGVLMLPVIGVLDSARATRILEELLARIVVTSSRYAIVDLTGVENVDASTADHLLRIVRSVELLGARAVVTGIRPAVAQTMISLGTGLSTMVTLGNLEEGLQTCIRWLGQPR